MQRLARKGQEGREARPQAPLTQRATGRSEAPTAPPGGLVQASVRTVPAHLRLTAQPHQEGAQDLIQRSAQAGRATPASELPHAELIQSSFGRHDISHIQAHVGSSAAASARAMGAAAYATGRDVVFAGRPDLHLAAHEAAHVVQQRAGIHLSGGIGQVGDSYEQHADAVADRVVAGRSAEALLDPFATGAPSSAAPVQRALATYADIPAPGTHNRWGAFYTAPDNHTKTRDATASGRGADVEGAGVAWTTNITWGPVRADDGTSMVANPLGPDHPLGSTPASDPKNSEHPWNKKRRDQESRAGGKQEYRAGHLLNEGLGGPGDDARNLAAIPAVANSQHSTQVEQKVKKIVNEGHGWVYYKVETGQERDNGSSGKPIYTAKLKCEWYQLDPNTWQQANPAAGKVAGTDGKVSITIPPPSFYAGGGSGLTRVNPRGAGVARTDRAATTAWSKVSRRSVVLVDTETLSAQALVMGPINDLLDQMEISEHIQSVDHAQLTNSLSAIVKATTLSTKESDAYKLIHDEKERLETAAGGGRDALIAYDPPADLRTALTDAPVERLQRYQTIEAAVKTLYELVHTGPHAGTLLNLTKEAWAIEDKPRREAEELCVLLLSIAAETKTRYKESVSVGLTHVAPARSFFGQDAIDITTPLHQQVSAMQGTESIDMEGVSEAEELIEPMTPLRQRDFDEEVRTDFPLHELRGERSAFKALSTGYRRYGKVQQGAPYLRKVKEVGQRRSQLPASNYDDQLITLLNGQKAQIANAKAKVNNITLAHPDLGQAAWNYLDAMENSDLNKLQLAAKAIHRLYRQDAYDVRNFFRDLEILVTTH